MTLPAWLIVYFGSLGPTAWVAYRLGALAERTRTMCALHQLEAQLVLRASQRAHDAAVAGRGKLRVVRGDG